VATGAGPMLPRMRGVAAASINLNPMPGELRAIKKNARSAYTTAKRKGAAPAALCDRWFSDALLTAQGQPEPVQAILSHRTEVLFALLLDRTRWINRPDAEH
jgi:hypothetical protein